MSRLAPKVNALGELSLACELRRLTGQLAKVSEDLRRGRQAGGARNWRRLQARKFRSAALGAPTWTEVLPGNGQRVGLVLSVTPLQTAFWSQAPLVTPVNNEGFGVSIESPTFVMLGEEWLPFTVLPWSILAGVGARGIGYEVLDLG